MQAAGLISGVASVIDFFRPSKSPYLLVIVAGIGGVLLACSDFIDEDRFFLIAVPIYIVLMILTHYSWISVDSNWEDQKKSEFEGQLKFSRAVCIICGLGCLVYSAKEEIDVDGFALIYMTSMFQIVVFVVYAAARVKIEEPATSANYFQMALVTSAFLIGATYCVFEWANTDNGVLMGDETAQTDGRELTEYQRRYLLSSILFYVYWGWCQIFWIKRLADIIQIQVRRGVEKDPK